jgi:histidinol-phosphate aminotransferase
LDRLTLAGGVAAMKDKEYFQGTRQKVINTREWVTEELSALGCSIIPSHANFVLFQHDKIHAKHLYKELRKQGILVRYIEKPRVNNYVRVSIGTNTEMKTFLEKIRGLL